MLVNNIISCFRKDILKKKSTFFYDKKCITYKQSPSDRNVSSLEYYLPLRPLQMSKFLKKTFKYFEDKVSNYEV